ncbi:hypothetical protein [Planococcus sp. YIM B11945]|uniref:hypothetical protein n=1 Tax=Planococcus sp. YIM B11945 TaxID=3435410 RepID=UPI003D7C93BB
MKKKLFLLVCLLVVSLMAAGCSSSESKAGGREVDSSVAKEAIDQGKLALADADLEKAKSNFKLALLEDAKNAEAKQCMGLIEKYEKFVAAVDEKDTDTAANTLEQLKADDKFALIEGMAKEPEEKLNGLVAELKELDAKIAALGELYNPEDENSMPDELYLVKSEELLANPLLTPKQKKTVENFKNAATDRANKLLAIEEEKMRAAEEEQAEAAASEATAGVDMPFPIGTSLKELIGSYGDPTYDDYFMGARLVVFNNEDGYYFGDATETVTGFMIANPNIGVFGTHVGMTPAEISGILGEPSGSYLDESETQSFVVDYYMENYKIFFFSDEEGGPTTSVNVISN